MYLRVLSAEGLRGTTVGSPTVVKPCSPRPDHLDQGRATHCTVILNVSLIEEGKNLLVSRYMIKLLNRAPNM